MHLDWHLTHFRMFWLISTFSPSFPCISILSLFITHIFSCEIPMLRYSPRDQKVMGSSTALWQNLEKRSFRFGNPLKKPRPSQMSLSTQHEWVAERKLWIYRAVVCKQLLNSQITRIGLFPMINAVMSNKKSREPFESRLKTKHLYLYFTIPSHISQQFLSLISPLIKVGS